MEHTVLDFNLFAPLHVECLTIHHSQLTYFIMQTVL